jgi:hypothetical protein
MRVDDKWSDDFTYFVAIIIASDWCAISWSKKRTASNNFIDLIRKKTKLCENYNICLPEHLQMTCTWGQIRRHLLLKIVDYCGAPFYHWDAHDNRSTVSLIDLILPPNNVMQFCNIEAYCLWFDDLRIGAEYSSALFASAFSRKLGGVEINFPIIVIIVCYSSCRSLIVKARGWSVRCNVIFREVNLCFCQTQRTKSVFGIE